MKKKCTKCGEDKELIYFGERKNRKSGYQSWCKSCKSKIDRTKSREIQKQKIRENPKIRLLEGAKTRAKKLNLEFNITQDDIEIPELCPVLGIPMYVGKDKRHDSSITIDRVDNTKGYIKENIKIISWRANKIKNDATLAELEKIRDYMYQHRLKTDAQENYE